MTRENILKIELQREIVDVCENVLVLSAKKIVSEYREGFKRMNRHQIESLSNISQNTSDVKLLDDTVIFFLNKQAAKNEKEPNHTWAFRHIENAPCLAHKIVQVLKQQNEQAKNIIDNMKEDYQDVLTGDKIIKKWKKFVQLQLGKNFITYIESWYNSLEVSTTLLEG